MACLRVVFPSGSCRAASGHRGVSPDCGSYTSHVSIAVCHLGAPAGGGCGEKRCGARYVELMTFADAVSSLAPHGLRRAWSPGMSWQTELAAGAIAGLCQDISMHPLDTLRAKLDMTRTTPGITGVSGGSGVKVTAARPHPETVITLTRDLT